MIIWGSKGKEIKVEEGVFFCPRCQRQSPYIHKRFARYFTLYFIPLFETKKLGEYIECQVCFTPYKPEVLEYSRKTLIDQRDIGEFQNELISKINKDLESGIPVQIIVKSLIEGGVPKQDALKILYIVTNGKIKICSQCEALFTGKLSFCSLCGGQLQDYEPK